MLGTGADSARPAGEGGEGEGYQARFLSPKAEGAAQVARCRYHRAVAVVQAEAAAEGDHRAAERLARLRLLSCRPPVLGWGDYVRSTGHGSYLGFVNSPN